MQTGYRYNREAQAKALKSAVRNRKRDKVLYGAIIKAEREFGSTSNTISTQTDARTISTQTGGAPPPAPPPAPTSALPASTSTAPSGPSSGPPASTSTAPSGPPSGPPNPFAVVLGQLGSRRGSTLQPLRTTGSAGPSTPQSAPVSTTHTPFISPEMIGSIKSNLTPPGTRVVRQLPPKSKTATELFQEELAAKAASRLNPVDSRQSNVGVISPTTSELFTPPTISPTSTIVSSSGRQVLVPKDQVPPLASIAETLKPVKGSPTSSDASTIASTRASTIVPTHPSVASPVASSPDEMPPLQVDLYDTNTDEGKAAQAMAKELITLIHQKQEEAGVNKTQQTTITSYRLNGSKRGERLIIKFNKKYDRYQFERKIGQTSSSMRFYPDKDNTGISVIRSLTQALEVVKQNGYNPKPAVNETTGLGISEDPELIGSSRVIYKSNKGADGVAKGQLYLMRPQLIKGHIRLYNKSGRPVVSRSNVSPSFQRIAKDIVERNTFEADDYSNVDPKESADVNKFIESTKPIQPRNINRLSNADTVWQLKKRYEVLVGELSAGNHGKLVRDEMETILRNLIRLHAMNQDKGRELIRSLREF
jgi:hypothetical protein